MKTEKKTTKPKPQQPLVEWTAEHITPEKISYIHCFASTKEEAEANLLPRLKDKNALINIYTS